MSAADADGKSTDTELPRRTETVLAHYSRNFKLAVVLIILALTLLPWALNRLLPGGIVAVVTTKQKHVTVVRAADKTSTGVTASSASATFPEGDMPSLNDQDDHTIKMVAAPDSALTEDTPQGSLPRISEDGRQPWQIYARPFNAADKRPRIAVAVGDLGLSRAISDAAIAQLPTNVTLIFSALSPVVGAWCARARQDGHEVILSVPMEPFDYPRSDPGPNTLLTSLPNSDNIERFLWALRQSTGYVGITTLSGSRFTTDPEKVRPILNVLEKRGLMIFDARVAPHSVVMDLAKYDHMPSAAADVRIDETLSSESIDKALAQLEQEARLNGRAVLIAAPTPLVIDRLHVWLKDLPAHGIALAPLSAVVQ